MTVMEDQQRVHVGLANVLLARRLIASMLRVLEPDEVALCEVTEMWQAFDGIERLGANAKTLLAARVEAAGSWRAAGARSPAAHLAQLGGTATNVAQRALENSKELSGLAAVADALREGVLSSAQVEEIVPAAGADPSAQDRLLASAGTNLGELRAECLRTKAAADPDPDATHLRIHKSRCARTFTDAEGAWNLIARGTADAGSRFESALEPILDALFERGRVAGEREPREAYAFDALLTLADRDSPTTDTATEPVTVSRSRPKIRYFGLLHLPFEALVRGAVAGEETCEIVGIGPVPVRIARELLGESILKLVITKGVDVANVTHLGRGPTAAQRIALLWSKPKCANIECSSMFVQIDHREPWAE
ncbi:MAG: hypothetical protein QOF59_407, partial [Actinomycetota bacterium]|nr:hypothetical protein [Actinomycetota bacterium]